jgi:hypothetical protein
MRKAKTPLAKVRQSPVGRGFAVRNGSGILYIGCDGVVFPAAQPREQFHDWTYF